MRWPFFERPSALATCRGRALIKGNFGNGSDNGANSGSINDGGGGEGGVPISSLLLSVEGVTNAAVASSGEIYFTSGTGALSSRESTLSDISNDVGDTTSTSTSSGLSCAFGLSSGKRAVPSNEGHIGVGSIRKRPRAYRSALGVDIRRWAPSTTERHRAPVVRYCQA